MDRPTILQKQLYFHVSYRRRVPATVGLAAAGIGDACQGGKTAALLNSLWVVFKISHLPITTASNIIQPKAML